MLKKSLTLLLFFAFNNYIIWAHGMLDERIVDATEAILKSPQDADLYARRALLYYQHEEFINSLDDLNFWRKYGGTSEQTAILYVKNYRALGYFKMAKSSINKLVNKHPESVILQRQKGQVYYELNEYKNATKPFEIVLDRLDKRLPENYLECAAAYYKFDYQSGKECLERGIKDIGNLYTLRVGIRDEALNQKNFKDAIEQQTAIVEMSNRKETPLYARALLYQKMGMKNEAKKDLEDALKAIKKLPASRANSGSMLELNRKLRDALEKY